MTTALRIPHGCKSANMSPTRAITVTIPQDIYKLQVGYVAGWVSTSPFPWVVDRNSNALLSYRMLLLKLRLLHP